MFLRRIFKGMPDMGPWVSVAECLAALATVAGTLVALKVVPSPFGGMPMGMVSGIVTDVNSGKPVPEATVQVVDSTSQVIAAESIPDAKGGWKESVKPGSYTIKAVCDGYRPAAKTVIVAEGKTRVVRLEIVPEPKGAAQAQAASTPTRTVETRIVTVGAPARGGGGGGSGGSAPERAVAAPVAPAQSGVEANVEKLMAEAKKLNNAEKQNDAIDKLNQATNLDPTDGRIYALAIKIRLNQGDNWRADAKDWHDDGIKNATKFKDQVEDAWR